MREWLVHNDVDVPNEDVGPDDEYSDQSVTDAIAEEYPGGVSGFIRTKGRPNNYELVAHAFKYLNRAPWQTTGHRGVRVRRSRIYVNNVSLEVLRAAVGMVIPQHVLFNRNIDLEEHLGRFSLVEVGTTRSSR